MHREHKGKKIKISETGETSGNCKIQIKDQRHEKETDLIREDEQRTKKRDEQSIEILQVVVSQKENLEQEVNIPSADSTQWSDITVRKKWKKKSYKFWQTPSNG